MKKVRLLAAALLAGLFVFGGGLPLAWQGVGHTVQAAGPVKGGTVIDGLYEEPDRLIPNTSSETFALMVDETIFAPLFYTDAKGVLYPGLAATIPTLANGGVSKDGLTYTFTMRPGLKWSDGQPLDARDVDYSWKIWNDPNLIINSSVGFNDIKSADVSSDNLSITFHLKTPYAPFISVWTDAVMPLPAHVLSKMTAKQLNTSSFTFQPTVSSGPFMISARKSAQSITEVRNPNYYQTGKPYLDKLIFRIIPDQTSLTNALSAHEIDAAWFLSVAQLNTLKSIKGYTFLDLTSPTIEYALLNIKNPILADVRVRQALEYGLDRPTEVADVWHGTAQALGSIVTPGVFGFNANIKSWPFDPVKAGKLLDQAGWKLGADGRRHKNGQTLTLRYSTTANNTWRAQDELIALQDYQALGIDLRIINYPASTYFGSILPGGNYDIGEFANNYVSFDPDPTIASAFEGNQLPPHGSNWGYYVNKSFDKLIAAEQSTADMTQRGAIFNKIQTQLSNDMPALWMYAEPTLAEYNNTLHNYSPSPFGYETWNSWNWWKS